MGRSLFNVKKSREINSWVDFPEHYRKVYRVVAAANRHEGRFPTHAASDADAFRLTRDQYIRDAKRAIKQEGQRQLGLLDEGHQ
jgi:hypothetical protein